MQLTPYTYTIHTLHTFINTFTIPPSPSAISIMRPSLSSSSREPRPAPRLKINKDSHSIHKPSTASSSSTTATSLVNNDYRTDPVIIYTHSPKVIHTEARDFMALVQKLTGMSSDVGPTDNDEDPPPLSSAAAMPQQNFEGSYNSNVVSCNSSSISSNSQLKDPLAAIDATAAVVPEEFHGMKDWTECLIQEESPYLRYQEMSSTEINSPALAAANRWMQPSFGYGPLEDQESLF